LEARGAFENHPERKEDRANEPVPTGELGDPPAVLTPLQKALWAELAEIIPPGVARNADRWAIEMAVRIMSRVRTGRAKGNEYSTLKSLLASFGMTPADRSRVKATIAPKEDEWADFGPPSQQ
jgi:hypothetical protein